MKLSPLVPILVCAGSYGFAAARAADTQCAISGRVLDGQKAVAGAKVVLFEYLQNKLCVGPLKSVTTSADGAYRFDGLHDSSYLVKAATSDSASNSATGLAPGLRLQFVNSGQRLTLDIALQKAARLALRVHRRDGEPLAGATFAKSPCRARTAGSGCTKTSSR